MTVGAYLSALRTMPLRDPLSVVGREPFLVLSPHPDDETLGLGGLIACAAAAGNPAHVAILTDGTGSHPNSTLYPAATLAALRRLETAAAVACLGLPAGRVTHLDYPDTRAPVEGQAFAEAVDRLVALVLDVEAATVFLTWERDPHCDHAAAALMARALRDALPAVALWFYPIWGWHLDAAATLDDPDPEGFRLDIAPWLPAKTRAIAAYASQMTDLIADDPGGFRFTEETLAPFLQPVETVFRVPR